MKSSPVTSLPTPLNLVAASPCMLALMTGFDHFDVDFFLMGDVAGYCRIQAEKSQSECNVLPEAQPISPLQATDWAIFIGDWVPYTDLKEWLVEHAGFTSSKEDNDFYLRYDLAGQPAPVTVALIPFSELEMLDEHWWIPTGFGMATNTDEIKFQSVLGTAPICPTHNGPVWQPVMLAEVMGQKLISLRATTPITACKEDAEDVCSLIKNYEFLEHEMIFLFHNDVYYEVQYINEYSSDSLTELQMHEINARILGRHMSFTMPYGQLLETLYSYMIVESSPSNEIYDENIILVMSRPRY